MAAVEAAVVAEAPLLVAHGTTGALGGGAGSGCGSGAYGGVTGAQGGGERARCCRAVAGFHDQHQNDAESAEVAPLWLRDSER